MNSIVEFGIHLITVKNKTTKRNNMHNGINAINSKAEYLS